MSYISSLRKFKSIIVSVPLWMNGWEFVLWGTLDEAQDSSTRRYTSVSIATPTSLQNGGPVFEPDHEPLCRHIPCTLFIQMDSIPTDFWSTFPKEMFKVASLLAVIKSVSLIKRKTKLCTFNQKQTSSSAIESTFSDVIVQYTFHCIIQTCGKATFHAAVSSSMIANDIKLFLLYHIMHNNIVTFCLFLHHFLFTYCFRTPEFGTVSLSAFICFT